MLASGLFATAPSAASEGVTQAQRLGSGPATGTRPLVEAPAGSGFAYGQWVADMQVPYPPLTISVAEGHTQEVAEVCGGPFALACASIRLGGYPVLLMNAEARQPRLTFYHEVGHLFEWTTMTTTALEHFNRILGLAPRNYNGEDFPEAFGHCAMRRHYAPFHRTNTIGLYSRELGASKINEVCRLIVHVYRLAASSNGWQPGVHFATIGAAFGCQVRASRWC